MSQYKLRYGDGYATIIKPTWNEENGLNCDEDILSLEEGGTIEANVLFKPRGSGALSKISNLDLAYTKIPDKPKEVKVDFYLEKIGVMEEMFIKHYQTVALTQVPYAADDAKTNVMCVKEHGRFEGMIDNFSVETLAEYNRKVNGSEGGASDSTGEAESKSTTGSKKKAASATASAKKSDDDKKKPVAKNSAAEKKSTKTKSVEEEEGGEDKKPAKSSSKKKKAAPKKAAAKSNNKEESSNDGDEEVVLATPTKKSKKKRKAKSEEEEGEEEEAEKNKPTPTKKKAKKDDKNDSSSEDDDGEDEEKEKEEKAPKVKRPPNGYMKFGSDVRPKIVEDNPDMKVTDVAREIGKAWRELTDTEKKQYQDEAHVALEKFKAEHPNLPKNTKGKKKKDKKKKDAKKGDDDDDGEEDVAVAVVVQADGNEDDDEDDAPKSDKESSKEKNEVKKKDTTKPKRPPNAYIAFSTDVRSKIKEENPDANPKEIMSKIGEAYQALPDDEKQVYKDAASEAMSKFKAEYGEDALKQNKDKKKKKSKKTKKKKEEEDQEDEEEQTGDKNNENDSDDDSGGRKKKKQKKDDDDVNNKAGSDGAAGARKRGLSLGGEELLSLPTQPADDLPTGWVTRSVPRPKGGRSDKYWFSPAKSFKFRSKAEVKRFRSTMEEVDGDESKAMEIIHGGGGEKKKKGAAAGGRSPKKSKKKKASGDDGDDGKSPAKKSKKKASGDDSSSSKNNDDGGKPPAKKVAAAKDNDKNDGGGSDEESTPDAWNA